jgi:hypothetical protein
MNKHHIDLNPNYLALKKLSDMNFKWPEGENIEHGLSNKELKAVTIISAIYLILCIGVSILIRLMN